MEVEYFTSKRKWVMTNLKNTTATCLFEICTFSSITVFLTVKDIFRMNIFYDEILSSKKSLIWNCLLVLKSTGFENSEISKTVKVEKFCLLSNIIT